MVLPGVRNKDRHLGFLVEDLLYTAVVDTLANIPCTLVLAVVLVRVIVAETISVCVIKSLVRWAGGRRVFAVVGSFSRLERIGHGAGYIRGERVAEFTDSDRWASWSNAPYGLLSSSFHMVERLRVAKKRDHGRNAIKTDRVSTGSSRAGEEGGGRKVKAAGKSRETQRHD